MMARGFVLESAMFTGTQVPERGPRGEEEEGATVKMSLLAAALVCEVAVAVAVVVVVVVDSSAQSRCVHGALCASGGIS
jgi:hypothetical protein